MSDSDSNQQETREEKIKMMDSMCVMVKGKQTYQGLTRRQWIDRFLIWCEEKDEASVRELVTGDFHVVELAKACE
eukprot:6670921-Prymnesium_polylepis.1